MKNIRIIGAGAGSGKTEEIARILLEKISGGTAAPEAVVATTFTRKAAAELMERTRLRLHEKGFHEKAEQLQLGLIGTVNSICGQILHRFAFEAGLSPELRITEGRENEAVFAEAIGSVLKRKYPAELDQISERFEIGQNAYQVHWKKYLRQIMDQARANRLDSADDLKKCAERSIESIMKILPPSAGNRKKLYLELKTLLLSTAADLRKHLSQQSPNKQVGGTKKYLTILETRLDEIERNDWISYPRWISLSKTEPLTPCIAMTQPVRDLAEKWAANPDLRTEIETMIRKLFDLAAECLEEYKNFKSKHGLIDFLDQEALVLDLLKNPDTLEHLKIDVLIVDEFQDTSPIQLAIFLLLAGQAKESIWVGDPKQSIYNFRGADPELMRAVVEALKGGEEEPLNVSYRSRPELVEFTNTLFTAAFGTGNRGKQILPKNVELKADRKLDNLLGRPISYWKAGNHAPTTTANGVAGILAGSLSVFDRNTGRHRPLEPGDICVLCRSNEQVDKVVQALRTKEITASQSQGNLLGSSEAKLLLACLRLAVDNHDSLAVAEICLLTDGGGNAVTVESLLNERLQFLAENKSVFGWRKDHSTVNIINNIRKELQMLSPARAVDLLIERLDLRRQVSGLGNPQQRQANLDAVRLLAKEYEELALDLLHGASLAGFLLFLDNKNETGEDRQSKSSVSHAVNVMTYHSAKGLEWPLVISAHLNSEEKDHIFGVDAIQGGAIELKNPLTNRWIKFWPNAFGKSDKIPGLENLETDLFAKQLQETERAESLRLLYVGLTRSRDYQILQGSAINSKGEPKGWLGENLTDAGLPIPPNEAGGIWQIGSQTIPVEIPDDTAIAAGKSDIHHFPVRPGRKQYDLLYLSPSKMDLPSPIKAKIGKTTEYGQRLKFSGEIDDDALGNVLHACIAAASPEMKKDAMKQRTAFVLEYHGQKNLCDAGDLTEQLSKFHEHLSAQFSPVQMHKEYPVTYPRDGQITEGTIDMLLETKNGWIIIDHKSFKGGGEQKDTKALEFAGQLHAYKSCVEAAGKKVIGTWIHFVTTGTMTEVGL